MLASFLALSLASSGSWQAAEPTPDQLVAELRKSGTVIERGASVRDVELRRDAARFTLKSGVLYLLGPVAGRQVAAVFVGNGAVDLVPPLPVERAELRRLLGDTTATTDFSAAVFVFADSTAAELGRSASFVPLAQLKDSPADRSQASGRFKDALGYLVDDDSKQLDLELVSALLNRVSNDYFTAYLARTCK